MDIIETLVPLVSLGLTVLIAIFLFRLTRKLRLRKLKIAIMIFIILLLLPLSYCIGVILGEPYQIGIWRCFICSKYVYYETYSGFILHEKPLTYGRYSIYAGEECYVESNNLYEKWYWDNIGIKHKHQWNPISFCDSGVFMRLMGEIGGGLGQYFYESIPLVPDKSIAVSMARRIALATPDECKRLLDCFELGYREIPPDVPKEELDFAKGEEPWISLIRGKYLRREVSQEDFLKYYKIWLKYHPEWE